MEHNGQQHRVYDDPVRYWAEYIADFNLIEADKIQEKYSDYYIIRAGLTKQKHNG